jgi:hypothetical protein
VVSRVPNVPTSITSKVTDSYVCSRLKLKLRIEFGCKLTEKQIIMYSTKAILISEFLQYLVMPTRPTLVIKNLSKTVRNSNINYN